MIRAAAGVVVAAAWLFVAAAPLWVVASVIAVNWAGGVAPPRSLPFAAEPLLLAGGTATRVSPATYLIVYLLEAAAAASVGLFLLGVCVVRFPRRRDVEKDA